VRSEYQVRSTAVLRRIELHRLRGPPLEAATGGSATSVERCQLAARTWSSICSGDLAPHKHTVTAGCDSTQAMASSSSV